ncbi:MAG: GNAT family N-acetyltransferase [Actinomycetales bacterium]|nr:GNAT family N-acetyltransferase [Actinomycetales bacterium]
MVEVRRLSPAELGPFLDFMDGPAFAAQPQWAGCHCQFYLNTREQNDDPAAKTGLNRERACDRVNAGTMQGYLAFERVAGAERVIGWMAANASTNFLALPGARPELARILCFVVDQEFQGRGVATELLRYALSDLPSRGFKMVEAAPLAADEFVAYGYRGPLSMFLKQGFQAGQMLDEKHILVSREL